MFIDFKAVITFYILLLPTCSEGSLGLNPGFGFLPRFFFFFNPPVTLDTQTTGTLCAESPWSWTGQCMVACACVFACAFLCVFQTACLCPSLHPRASCRDYVTLCLEKHRRVSAVHMPDKRKERRNALTIFILMGQKCHSHWIDVKDRQYCM